jgi:hypothetical protein
MKKLLILALLAVASFSAGAILLTPTNLGTPYCLPAAPTAVVGSYVSAYIVAMTGDPVTSIQERDSAGKYYVTTFTYTGSTLVSTSCPLQYSTQQ